MIDGTSPPTQNEFQYRGVAIRHVARPAEYLLVCPGHPRDGEAFQSLAQLSREIDVWLDGEGLKAPLDTRNSQS